MAEKKRKEASEPVQQPAKKSKKSSIAGPRSKPAAPENVATEIPIAVAVPSKKQTRKRATDFLDDEKEPVQEAAVVKGKRSKKGDKKSATLTADGVNGVVEQKDDENVQITTSEKQEPSTSMMAEAERTQDQELTEEFGDDDDDIDTAPALLAGFDSDTEDQGQDTADVSSDRTAPIPQFKKTSKKLRKAKESAGQDKPGAVYIGRIPHGFYEPQMRAYFSQFGDISRLRLSRNKKTGASKHFAFIEFTSEEVAKIVAETMDNYLMFGHILKCKFAPEGSLHDDVWKGANKKYRQIPRHKLVREKEEKPKTVSQWEKKTRKEAAKRKSKAEQLKKLGYEFKSPVLKAPRPSSAHEASEAKSLQDQNSTDNPDVTGTLNPPPSVPKDEIITKKEEDKKVKTKKSKSKAKAEKEDAEAKRDTVVEETSRAEIDAAMKEHKKKEQKAGKRDKKATPAAPNGAQLKGILKKPKI